MANGFLPQYVLSNNFQSNPARLDRPLRGTFVSKSVGVAATLVFFRGGFSVELIVYVSSISLECLGPCKKRRGGEAQVKKGGKNYCASFCARFLHNSWTKLYTQLGFLFTNNSLGELLFDQPCRVGMFVMNPSYGPHCVGEGEGTESFVCLIDKSIFFAWRNSFIFYQQQQGSRRHICLVTDPQVTKENPFFNKYNK